MPVLPMRPTIDWTEITSQVKTGDLFLFAGDSWQSVVVEDFTNGPYSHVAMVVMSSTGTPLLWQSNPTRLADDPANGPDTHHALPEGLLTDAGAQLGYLDQALNTINNAGDHAFYRPFNGHFPADWVTKVGAVIAAEKHKPFGSLSHMAWAYGEGQLGIDAGIDSFFCSQLVAYTYQQGGLLDPAWPPNSYAPNDFDMARTPTLTTGGLGQVRPVDSSSVPGFGPAAS